MLCLMLLSSVWKSEFYANARNDRPSTDSRCHRRNSIAQLYACIVLDSTKAPYSTQGVLELYNAGAKPAEQIERVVAQDALPKLPVCLASIVFPMYY